ncbi:MAG: short-chain fatty acid transporter [Chitinophagales bacterium]|nr:short-chain fatty acid transporter [Chitinophagales bacterium]
MSFLKSYNNFFQKYFPNPFTIAIALSFISFLLAFFFTQSGELRLAYVADLADYWYAGLFKASLLEFTMHMMLILVLGHILALSKPIKALIANLLQYCTSTKSALVFVSLFSLFLSLFNWGFGLVFSAIFVKEIGAKFQRENKKINYPILAAAAYAGMMVWHGGLSGSASLSVASTTHSFVEQIGVISVQETLFSSMNIFTSLLLVLALPLFLVFIASRLGTEAVPSISTNAKMENLEESTSPIETFESKTFLGRILGFAFLGYFILLAYRKLNVGSSFLEILNLQSINLLLLGLSLLFHGSFKSFLLAVEEAIGDVSGILIQFPLYFGIMGLIQSSGMALLIADGFSQISNSYTLPIYTFLSAALLNIFIPSGGGQWQVQAPIIIESAKASAVALPKLIMAMSYGDQLTNMLQPFWALPLLSICQLKAKDILPYCLFIFALGAGIFLLSLVIF